MYIEENVTNKQVKKFKSLSVNLNKRGIDSHYGAVQYVSGD